MKPSPVVRGTLSRDVRGTLSRDDPQQFMAACCCCGLVHMNDGGFGGLGGISRRMRRPAQGTSHPTVPSLSFPAQAIEEILHLGEEAFMPSCRSVVAALGRDVGGRVVVGYPAGDGRLAPLLDLTEAVDLRLDVPSEGPSQVYSAGEQFDGTQLAPIPIMADVFVAARPHQRTRSVRSRHRDPASGLRREQMSGSRFLPSCGQH